MNFDLSSSGFFSSLPMLALTLSEVGVGYFSDWLVQKTSLIRTRRVTVLVGAFGCAASFLFINFIGCSITWAMILLNFSMLFLGFYCVNVQSNVLDFGSQYAGRINAISNTLSNSAGFLAPQISGVIFDHLGQSRQSWGYVFVITTVICFTCALFFCFFMSVQKIYSTSETQELKKSNS